MKKKTILWLLLAALLLTACVPTPAQEFVVNKGDGAVEQKIGEAANAGDAKAETAEQRFPDRWDEEQYAVNDWLKIAFRADILQKDDGLYPVYRTRPAEITDAEATAWANALLPAPTSVSGLEMTKDDYKHMMQRYVDEIEAKRDWIAAGKPDDGVDRDEWVPTDEEYQQELQNYQKWIEQAPETNEATPVSDYRSMPEGERHYTLSDGGDACIYKRKDYFSVAKGCIAGPYVYYDYYYEEEKDEDDMPWPKLWVDVTMPEADAEAILNKELERLGFSDFSLIRADRANLMDSGEGGLARRAGAGWSFKLHRALGGYPTVGVPYEPSQFLRYGSDNTVANAYIRAETLELFVDENGVEYFGYGDKKEAVGIENTNVELLPFEEVQTRIKNALAVCFPIEWAKESNMPAELEVYRLLLTSYTVHIKDSTDYYEMPVWVVFFDQMQWGDSRTREMADLMHDALFINAVDGSILHTDYGY